MAEAEERLNAYYRQQQEAALVRRPARRRSANLPGLDVPAYVTAADLIDEAATWGIRPSAATAVVAETLDQVLAAIPATPGSWPSSASKPNECTRHGERYLRELQARTELKRVNHELKQLRAQLTALEERRAALLSELAEQGS